MTYLVEVVQLVVVLRRHELWCDAREEEAGELGQEIIVIVSL
jgi:hypothetical protein